ncbi:hypothetical protein K1719_044129 [Acacia pycnantha]|nr:hypothetical protein K1719_044129 [Acacia pycnantha]
MPFSSWFQGRLFGFTKAKESSYAGRLAQLGFVFSLIGEIITGKGALAHQHQDRDSINEIEPLVLFNVPFFFVPLGIQNCKFAGV